MNPSPWIGVIGAGRCSAEEAEVAVQVGRLLAEQGMPVLCGGLGGVMSAVARGVKEKGGLVVGVLPGSRPDQGNEFLSLTLATGLGEARNLVIVHSAAVLIAIAGEYGTLSEIAFARKAGKTVISLGSWPQIPGLWAADSPEHAVELVRQALQKSCRSDSTSA
ncbi:MAG: TIGR00725 family protein [Planctomycetota bacterium]|nr:MAG: TIGR00725 family protein [Planctomycetota bacterium]